MTLIFDFKHGRVYRADEDADVAQAKIVMRVAGTPPPPRQIDRPR